ncbi:hypothetical protein RchiOBHm_Chr1g0351661 [Rosa chinensis]|uniref:Uncharacterized protein n=1 Tax=Rosa chinensis TaxID=74649 RepID=A0A2P6SGE6_ROSCH|nr:hypothetical protein RchiOBHm_Chr1g0351661 [Rosa chinensis]
MLQLDQSCLGFEDNRARSTRCSSTVGLRVALAARTESIESSRMIEK